LRRDRAGDLPDLSFAVDQIVEAANQISFRPHAVVDGLYRYAGIAGNVLEARRGIAVAGKPRAGRGEQVGAGLFGL
jgi:hypothetical protein